MKKVLLMAVICLLGISTTYAQKGDVTVAARATGLDLTLGDDYTDFSLGVAGTYFVLDKLAIEAGLGFEYTKFGDNDSNGVGFQIGARYYVWNNLYAGIAYEGVKFKDIDFASALDFHVGYDYFFNDKVFISPSLFYNLGFDNVEDTYGLSVAIGVKF